ncbi:hypothetical protein Trydic_g23723 [Trypoxylus dichotomus]
MIFKLRSFASGVGILVILVCVDLISCQSTSFVERQLLCALDRAPCDDLGNQIKAILPEIIARRCRNCSPSQITYANSISKYIQQNYPQAWGALLEKYG